MFLRIRERALPARVDAAGKRRHIVFSGQRVGGTSRFERGSWGKLFQRNARHDESLSNELQFPERV